MMASVEDRAQEKADWRNAEDRSEPPEPDEGKRSCEACYWWERCPCGNCDWGVCGNIDSAFCGDYTRANRSCGEWEE